MNMENMYVDSAATKELIFVASWINNMTNFSFVADWY